MKMILLLILITQGLSFAQSPEDESYSNPALSTEEEHLPLSEEIEEQEEVLHPYGETNDWSLGSEDLPAEDYD